MASPEKMYVPSFGECRFKAGAPICARRHVEFTVFTL